MSWTAFADAAEIALPALAGPRWGTAVDWATMLTLVLSGLILVGILVSRVLYRGRQTEGQALGLHLLALGIFPLFLLAVGNFAVLEHATEVQFCGTCHVTMKPYIDDLYDPKGESLAAVHHQHRVTPGSECYACHANYGVHGTFKAKATGLQHVYRYWTGTYQRPIKMYTPYENGLCLKCHDGAKRFRAQPIHLDDAGQQVAPEFLNGQTDCVQCHGPAHAIARRKTAALSGEAR